jgi:hypothetical protein
VLPVDEQTMLRLYDAEEYPAWVACAKLIRRELIAGYPFRIGRIYEDNEAVCRWVCGGKKLATMDHKLYFYRTNQGSTTKSSFSIKKLDYLWALESIIRYYSSLGFEQMRQRFLTRYVDAVVSSCNGLRYMLGQEAAVKDVEKQFRKFAAEQKLKLSQSQFEALLDATHPKLIKFCWPAAAAARMLREQGVSGMAKKMMERTRKGTQK